LINAKTTFLDRRILVAEEVDRIEGKYGWHITLGDQDYITNLGFEVNTVMYKEKLNIITFACLCSF
jgi:hypothetical protein